MAIISIPATLVVRVVRSGSSVCVCLCSHNDVFLFKLPLTYLSQMLNRNLDPYYTILFHNVLLFSDGLHFGIWGCYIWYTARLGVDVRNVFIFPN